MGASSPLALPSDVLPCDVPEDGEWWISRGMHVTCEDVTLVLRNITISPLASLTLRNVDLVIDARIDSDGGVTRADHHIDVLGNAYGIVPGYGGALHLHDTTVRSRDPDFLLGGIFVHGGSTLVVHDSELRDFYAAVFMFSNVEHVEVMNSLIYATMHGVFSHHSDDVLIQNNLFVGTGTGVEVIGRAGTIRDNTFTNCDSSIYLNYESAAVKDFSHNTITNCQLGLGANSCAQQNIQHNDIFRNENDRGRDLPTWESATCGSAENNWWGETGPDPARMARPVDYSPWLHEPLHPERLPTAAIDPLEVPVHAGEAITFSAAGSRPSETWNSPLADFRWDFGDGKAGHGPTATHAFPRAGTHQVSLLVTDELGISRMAFLDVQVEPRRGT